MPSLPNKLIDKPAFSANTWEGYFRHIDPTMQKFNTLTYPSVNCSIPAFDKVVPDKGKKLIGQAYSENVGIVGHKEAYKNQGGIEMEVRVWKSADANLKDVIDVLYTEDRLLFNNLTGSFQLGETVTGGTSNENGTITYILGDVITLSSITGDFQVGETITGDQSGATAEVVFSPTLVWRQITENTNPLNRGVHEYYMTDWFEKDLNPDDSKNLRRLIWTNGYKDNSNGKGEIFSWTGGIGLITAVTGTNIDVDSSTTWRSLGFTEDANGDAFIVVNGVSYQIATPTDLDTSSINVTSTVGISLGDIATSKIEVDESSIPFDMCRQAKGYVYYGNWKAGELYQANQFNHNSTQLISDVSALQNDLIIPISANFTGQGSHVYKVTIDSVNPPVEVQSFLPGGSGASLNDGRYDTTTGPYSGTPGSTNIYKTLVVADGTLGILTSSITGAYFVGETVTGSGTGAESQIVAILNYLPGVTSLVVKAISGSFEKADTVTGNSSGATGTFVVTGPSVSGQDWIQFYKNDILTTLTVGPITGTLVPISVTLTTTLTDGLIINWGNYFGHAVGDAFLLTINQGGADTFQWQVDGAVPTTGVPITGATQTLSDGVDISFVSRTGHSIGDFWEIQVDQDIKRAWTEFYYTNPIRKPGEGYVYQLPSNFWTMDIQEDSMYINSSYGEWSLVKVALSADLQSEEIILDPLKQVSTSKVLYPYLTGHTDDDLVFVTEDKNLTTLGRQIYMEKPQTGYVSDPVKKDFEAFSFKGGRIEYQDKKLYISSPEDGMMVCFDKHQGYWQPPKMFPEMGILSRFGGKLMAHSNTRNQSFFMFESESDNGSGYEVVMRTPSTPVTDRWAQKLSSQSFIEGYIEGSPVLKHTVFLGVNGCGGVASHDVYPIICATGSQAPLGQGELGSHALASDDTLEGTYFQEIYKSYAPMLEYYFISLQLSCVSKNHTYSLLSMGMNGMESLKGNNQLINPSNLPT